MEKESTKKLKPAEAAIAYDKVIRKIKKAYFGKLKKEMKGTVDEYNKKNYPKDS